MQESEDRDPVLSPIQSRFDLVLRLLPVQSQSALVWFWSWSWSQFRSGSDRTVSLKALAAALCEARRQHPELSVTRVVVHKETEVPPDHMIN